MRPLGYILSIAGLVLLGYSIFKYLEETESFSFLGSDIVISKGDPMPIVITAIVTAIGLILVFASKKKR